jgi:hypothetical protein
MLNTDRPKLHSREANSLHGRIADDQGARILAIRDCKPVTARLAVRKLLAQTDRTIERGRVRRSSQQKA